MKTSNLTLTDRLGIFYGTILFFASLPLMLFLSSIPASFLAGAIENKVLSLTLSMGTIGVGIFLSFIQGMVVGLAMSYALSWLGRTLGIQKLVSNFLAKTAEVEKTNFANRGAMIGAGVALLAFVLKGEVPISSINSRVEHLFPEPLVISLGNQLSLNLSHTYAAATGFLTVGFLFLIAGVVIGSLSAAAAEKALNH